MEEPAVLASYRRRVLRRVEEGGDYQPAEIEDVDPEVIFPTFKRAREDADRLLEHPDLADAPIVERVPPEAR